MDTSNPESVPPSSPLQGEGLSGFVDNFFLAPDWGNLAFLASTIIIFIGCSALISGAEVALFSMRSSQLADIRESENRKDKVISSLLTKPKYLLATILIANNFVNILIVILFSSLTLMLFNMAEYPAVGFFIEVVLVTFVLVLLGEITPKVYANQHSLRFSRFMSLPLMVLNKIFYPLSTLLVTATRFIDKRIKKKGHDLSVDELNHAIDLTADDVEKEEDKDILKGIAKFGGISVKQIMRSRVDITGFEVSTGFKTLVKEIVEAGYSRVPVYEENIDNIKGILFIKDLLPYLGEEINVNWQNLIRQAFFVPESKKIDDLLKEFQLRRMHMAIVVDEYGGTSGIVTLEDILEEIVGEINDELDDTTDDIKYSKLDDKNYVFEAKMAINDLYKIMSLDDEPFEKIRGEADTLGGLILEITGKLPQLREELHYDRYKFKIESVDKRRIKRVKISILDEPVKEEEMEEKKEN